MLGYDVRRSPMAVRRRLGYVPQQLSIEAALTGRENVTWFARLFDVPRTERKERVDDALEAMGLADVGRRLAGTYSGGMIRRLELAQALVNRPAAARPRRADRRARPGRPRRRLAAGRGDARRHRDDRAADDALHGGGGRPLRPVALMHLGRIRAEGSPEELKAELGPDATLEDVFRQLHGQQPRGGGRRKAGACARSRSTRRTAGRVG